MSKEAFTPGPWAIQQSKQRHDGQFDFAVHATKAKVLAEAFGRDSRGNIINAEANARLIAAAPDFAEASRNALDYAGLDAWLDAPNGNSLDVFGIRREHLLALRAAISKATGAA